MTEFDSLSNLASIGLLVLATIGFTALGVLGEQAALGNLLAGQTTLGLWELFVGAWALFVGVYLLGVRQVVPRVSSLLA
jgi:hypothetical protein